MLTQFNDIGTTVLHCLQNANGIREGRIASGDKCYQCIAACISRSFLWQESLPSCLHCLNVLLRCSVILEAIHQPKLLWQFFICFAHP